MTDEKQIEQPKPDPAAEVLKAAARWAPLALKAFLAEHPERTAELAGVPLQVRVSRIDQPDPTVTLAALTGGEVEMLFMTQLKRIDPADLN